MDGRTDRRTNERFCFFPSSFFSFFFLRYFFFFFCSALSRQRSLRTPLSKPTLGLSGPLLSRIASFCVVAFSGHSLRISGTSQRIAFPHTQPTTADSRQKFNFKRGRNATRETRTNPQASSQRLIHTYIFKFIHPISQERSTQHTFTLVWSL